MTLIIEEVTRMNLYTEIFNPKVESAPDNILNKHFMRKHGPNAYYGQENH